MSNLFGSIVRGFGFTIGRRAADSFLSSGSSVPAGRTHLSTKQVLLAFVLWGIGFSIMKGLGVGIWIFVGIPTCVGLIQLYNWFVCKKEDSEEKKYLIQVLPNLVEQAKQLPLTIELSDFSNPSEYSLSSLRNSYNYLNNLTTKFYPLLGKYDTDTLKKIMVGDYWIGMTEEHLIDMKGHPTTTEQKIDKKEIEHKTYVYGTKRSGDILKFENGILVTYTDR